MVIHGKIESIEINGKPLRVTSISFITPDMLPKGRRLPGSERTSRLRKKRRKALAAHGHGYVSSLVPAGLEPMPAAWLMELPEFTIDFRVLDEIGADAWPN